MYAEQVGTDPRWIVEPARVGQVMALEPRRRRLSPGDPPHDLDPNEHCGQFPAATLTGPPALIPQCSPHWARCRPVRAVPFARSCSPSTGRQGRNGFTYSARAQLLRPPAGARYFARSGPWPTSRAGQWITVGPAFVVARGVVSGIRAR